MKVIALIPARSGSKRVPDKNIKKLGGVPLMVHSIITAQRCINIDEVWVSTDSIHYANIAGEYNVRARARPPILASDTATDLDVVYDFIKDFVDDADLIVYLRPTTPFRYTDIVDKAISLMMQPGYDSLRSVEQMPESAAKCFQIKAGLLKSLEKEDRTDLPNQLLPPTYKPNGYVDIVRSENVLQGSLWGQGRYAFKTNPTIEIDTPEDFEYAEWYINHKGRKFIG